MTEPSHQITGHRAIAEALDRNEPLELLLVRRGVISEPIRVLVERAHEAGIRVKEASPNDLERMARDRAADVLALSGRSAVCTLSALLDGPGAVWLLSGLTYPSNVGALVRTAEVTGAAGVVADVPFPRADKLRARRISMRADRFLPLLWEPSDRVVERARASQRPIVVVEDTGTAFPWEVDLTGRPLLVVGAERDGVSGSVVRQADVVVRLPAPGFVGSYNVQAAAAVVAYERLRQLDRGPGSEGFS